MKAVQILGDVSSPKINTTSSLPKPTPTNAELLINVHAAGVTGDEIVWPEPYNTPTRIPGHDISGVIASVGPKYTGPLGIGQAVYALLATERGQGQAEYAICEAEEVARKPESVTHSEAAALPIPLLTAWEVIEEHGRLEAGMRVLVTGASGAVGSSFVQLVRKLVPGVHVIALASSRNHNALRELGASEVVDYNTPNWERSIRDVDVVFDTVGGDVLAKTWEVVKETGKIVTIGDPAPAWAFGGDPPLEAVRHPNVRYQHFIVSPNSERLGKVAEMVDDGSVKGLEVMKFPFEEAAKAWEDAQKRNRGYKVVIEFA